MDYISLLLWQTFWFFLPAFLGNLSPVIGKYIWKTPFKWRLDGGMKFRGQDLFGVNKSVGGVVSAIVGGGIAGLIVMQFGQNFGNSIITNTVGVEYIYLGMLMGFGAIAGDLLESFFKRRINIPAGQPLWFFDQTDFVAGAWISSWLFIPYYQSWQWFLFALIVTPPIHLGLNILAFKLKLKKVWW